MDSFTVIAGRIAGLVTTVAFVPYTISVLRGHTRPSLSSWLIWTVVGAVICASHWAAGGHTTFWVPLSYVVGPFAMTILALRHGEKSWSRFDQGCIASAAVSLALWAVSGNPLVALCMNITVDFLGALPTIRKSWNEPESEDRLAWALFLLGNGINLLAVEGWNFSSAVYPIYVFLVSVIMMILLLRPRKHIALTSQG